MSAESLLSLHDKLREDRWRARHAFSKDMQQATKPMLKPFVYDHEVAEVLRLWCMKRQPCQFGRAAANRGQIHFCVLRERDLADGDDAIKEKIATARQHWKQRALSDTQTPPHSFTLVFATDGLMLAAPDENLRRFADRLLELAGWGPDRQAKRGENPISSDFLYLQNPVDDAYYGFQFNIDFFAAAGDKRWWHDHRLPGGIGFTANSTGHMKTFLDWYTEKGCDHGEWALKQAMITVAQAHPTKGGAAKSLVDSDPRAEGRLTWLRNLDAKGRPLLSHLEASRGQAERLRGVKRLRGVTLGFKRLRGVTLGFWFLAVGFWVKVSRFRSRGQAWFLVSRSRLLGEGFSVSVRKKREASRGQAWF